MSEPWGCWFLTDLVFADFDWPPVVNMSPGAEKGTNAPVRALRGSSLLRYITRWEYRVCVCVCVFDPSVLCLPSSYQTMIKIMRSLCLLIRFALTWSSQPQIRVLGQHRSASDHKGNSRRSHLVRINRSRHSINLRRTRVFFLVLLKLVLLHLNHLYFVFSGAERRIYIFYLIISQQ